MGRQHCLGAALWVSARCPVQACFPASPPSPSRFVITELGALGLGERVVPLGFLLAPSQAICTDLLFPGGLSALLLLSFLFHALVSLSCSEKPSAPLCIGTPPHAPSTVPCCPVHSPQINQCQPSVRWPRVSCHSSQCPAQSQTQSAPDGVETGAEWTEGMNQAWSSF